MNQLQAMRVFTRVVGLGSFNLAARQLGVSAASVTRSIGLLEAHLHTRLINRTTRTLSLTEAGRDYLEGCRAIIEQLDEMETSLIQSTRELRGALRIASVATFADGGLVRLVAAYRELHPGVSFEVTTFDVHIDMVEGGFDVCFSDDPGLFSSALVCRPLLRIPQIVVASPQYLSRHATPVAPADLTRHTLLYRSGSGARCWEFVDRNRVSRVTASAGIASSSYAMLKSACTHHLGIALLPRSIVESELQRGALVELFEQFSVGSGARNLCALYSSPGLLSRRVRSFVDFAVDHYRAMDRTSSLKAVA
ncbi:LysR family transcriptional regulator [Paraburkholderia fynbosensis]|nr:LysR family transcriptional regulator [Paraburkholderia fynbosensis]